MKDNHSPKHVLHAFLAAGWILVAAVLALYVLPTPWDGLGGRDFRPHGANLFVLLVASGLALRYAFRWSWISLLGGLVIIEVATLLLIGHFSGSEGADLLTSFNLRWLAFVNIFIAIPWLVGVASGSWLLRYKGSRARG